MLFVAVLIVVLPLWKQSPVEDTPDRSARLRIVLPIVLGLPVATAGLYLTWSTFDWQETPASTAQDGRNIDELLTQLEGRLAQDPSNAEGWTMLGRSYVAIGRFARGVEAYEKAYDLTGGKDPDIATGLAEALALVDEASLSGRAGQIFEQVLAATPNHPKALWYGAVMALRANNLPLARERMQTLLALNPPDELKSALEQQLADVRAQLGEAPEQDAVRAAQAPAAGGRSIEVEVSIASELASSAGDASLFILARDPANPGPPLAAVRRRAAELPLQVNLSDADAMIPGRTISKAAQIEIVARVSKSGQPVAATGDLFGSAEYAPDGGKVSVVIDRVVP
jgi:cytochrome c-type biogenesis protein CcmH